MDDAEVLNMTLSKLLNVEFPRDFFSSYYSVRPCHLRPGSERALPFGWDDLNVALRSNRFAPPRLRLAHSRPEALANINLHSWTGTGTPVALPSLKQSALYEGLSLGATLVLNNVHEVSENLRNLALAISAVLHEVVSVNCYASFRTDENFGPHRDPHDVFAYQVAGSKRWLLFSSTDPGAIHEIRPIEDTCPQQVVADITLEEGDVLYVPRGYWHKVNGLNQPSLHLTIGVTRKRAIDLLRSLISRLDEHPFWTATIPRYASPARLSAFQEELRSALKELGQCYPSIKQYFDISDLEMPIPLVTNLPWSVVDSEAITDDVVIIWRAHSGHFLTGANGQTYLRANGTEFELSSAGKQIVELISTRPLQFNELRTAIGERNQSELKNILKAFAKRGFVELKFAGNYCGRAPTSDDLPSNATSQGGCNS
jgi:hypothetical protein